MSYRARGHSSGRILAANAALVITDADGVGHGYIELQSTNSSAITATFSWISPSDPLGGASFDVLLAVESSTGSYIIPCTYLGVAGAVTLDAALERPSFQRIGSTLYCTGLGGATFA